jgi:hypothetical protein
MRFHCNVLHIPHIPIPKSHPSHGSPSSGIKMDDTFIGGHQLSYHHIYDMTRETTDMGPVNLHNRDRFYVPGDTPMYSFEWRMRRWLSCLVP